MSKRDDSNLSSYGAIDLPDSTVNLDKNSSQYRSDTLINYEHADENDKDDLEAATEVIIATTCCKSSYVIEPVAFIQNLASSIMNFSLGLFIYNRIFNRLLEQQNNNNHTNFSLTLPRNVHYMTTLLNSHLVADQALFAFSNSSDLCNANSSNVSTLLNPLLDTMKYSSSDIDTIRVKAQEETSTLYFYCSLISAIPVLLMTNVLGVNCSNLGRKTLVVVYLFVLTCRYTLVLLQCLYPEWPDWLFYVGALIEGLGGGSGCFYLALYCFISDLTHESSRSFRITFVNNLNSFATLSVTFICGYVIKYYGYFYLFLTSSSLALLSLSYTVLFIPEPLVELKAKSYWTRIKSCSVRRSLNCVKVFFNEKECISGEESQRLLDKKSYVSLRRPKKQTFILFLIVFANFIFCFGAIGVASIFNLYLMNKPFCFDSIQISNYTIFNTITSLVMTLLVSRFVKVSDLFICIISIGSYFISVFCYIYGDSVNYIYLASIISSIAGLEFGYIRSIVSKSVERREVSDALTFILIVDTFIAVVSMIIYPVLYSFAVSRGIKYLFMFSNIFVFMALVCHM